MNSIVFVNFECNESTKVVAQKIWQYDYGQILRIQGLNLPAAVEIHFSLQKTGGIAERRIGVTRDGVTDVVIPDFILKGEGIERNYSAYAFIYLSDEESGQTEHRIELNITSRPEPEGSSKEDDTSFGAIMDAVNEIAKQSSQGVSDEKIQEAVNSYMEANPVEGANVTAEKISEVLGYTPAKETDVSQLQDTIADIKQNGTGGSGITTAIKDALLNAFAHVAWIDENGQSYYDALSVALNPSGSDSEGGEDDETTTVTLSSISATYNGGEVTSGTKLADLTDIVVTATYSDGSTKNITTYELSGEIVTGENTITVSYGGLTTTFIVVATEKNRTYLTYGEHIAHNTGDTNVVKYSDDGETSVTYNQSYAHVVIENVFDHDVDVHFKYTHGGGTIYRSVRICSVDISGGIPEEKTIQSKLSYDFGAGAPRNAYNCKNLNDYYIEGQGTDYVYTGNVYEGIYTLKTGCMLLIISGSNNMTVIDNDNSYFYVEE